MCPAAPMFNSTRRGRVTLTATPLGATLRLMSAARFRPADPMAIDDAAQIVRRGGLVAFPTETVYGIGVDATNGDAVATLFAAKKRQPMNPLITHVWSLQEAIELGSFSKPARRLAETFWPGPLTIVVPRLSHCPVSLLA